MQNIPSFYTKKITNKNFCYLSTQNFLPQNNHHNTQFVKHLYTFALNRQCLRMFLETNVKKSGLITREQKNTSITFIYPSTGFMAKLLLERRESGNC